MNCLLASSNYLIMGDKNLPGGGGGGENEPSRVSAIIYYGLRSSCSIPKENAIFDIIMSSLREASVG